MPEESRRNNLKKFGLTLEDYEQIESAQDGKCAICRKKCTSGRRLAVDHDHKTNAVRGLLCARCNVSLGNFEDDVDLLRQAIKYLESNRAQMENAA